MFEMTQALWRPLTGFVMAGVVLAIAMGLLPPSAEAHANSLLTAAGSVLTALTVSRAVQRVQEVKAALIPGELVQGLSAVTDDAGMASAVADEVERRLLPMLTRPAA